MSNAARSVESQSIPNASDLTSTISSNVSRPNEVNDLGNVPHFTSQTLSPAQRHNRQDEQENNYYTSDEEFPEITEEEVEIWSRVERKRFHYRSFPQRDEYLLQQTLLLRPFEASTPKERAEKWQLVATRCDETMKKLPENATGLYNFYFGHHAKQRFRVLMEAHYGLLNSSSNPMFISIYGEYSNIKSLMEKAYDAYLLAGCRPGKNASFASKRTPSSAKRRRVDLGKGNMDDDSLTKLCKESRDILNSIKSILVTQRDVANDNCELQQNTVAKMLESNRRHIEDKLEGHVHMVERIKEVVEQERQHISENLCKYEEQLSNEFEKQETWMKDWVESQRSRQQEWAELYQSWMDMQKEMASMLRHMVEMQDQAETNRMSFLREMFDAKK
ncbi:predicted protein [Lichtheimia corymbifera JMRC:FSU:9682]|uniref:Uncharacterized protein n=1 Tax=Lichtheimia corymbifera JMRC:FSU:9682 TaxID=1263082 RepID=A0A068RTW7_9FUNG|nr:predicted protein [Lichtheimia corymbifera JMRC:FSU:9682]